MKYVMRLGLLVCFAASAFAQLDASALRAKFGAPLNRETFHMPEGFDLVVDYDAAHSVCRMQVPALMPSTGGVTNTDDMKQRMRAFLDSLVPASMRGRELESFSKMLGVNSVTSTRYEHVTITETQYWSESGSDHNVITVSFKDCGGPSPQR